MPADKPHLTYLCLGGNLGDRESNLAEALSRLRQELEIVKISSTYETDPVDFTDQPKFLNLVCEARTALAPEELLDFVKKIETGLGRIPQAERYRPRPIDIDILAYDQRTIHLPRLVVPHEKAGERAFVLIPWNEIAPGYRHPLLDKTVAELAAAADPAGVRKKEHGLLLGYQHDVQQEKPRHGIALDRVGLSGLRRVICLTTTGKPRHLPATLSLTVSLAKELKGTHMSRLGTAAEEILGEQIVSPAPNIESLAEAIARDLVVRLGAARADVEIRSEFPLTRHAPVSGIRSQEVYALIGIAAATADRSLSLIGVEAEGMTACPCAQQLARERAAERLLEEGFTPVQIAKVLETVPLPTHNQKGRGRLLLSAHPSVRAQDLVHLVEAAMSSETYGILKRPDEAFVVGRAHRHPKFVEDVVRDLLASVAEAYPELPDDCFVAARQTNLETIHKHDVVAERSATLGDIRANLAGRESAPATLEGWIARRLA